jgi:hypothetical protein
MTAGQQATKISCPMWKPLIGSKEQHGESLMMGRGTSRSLPAASLKIDLHLVSTSCGRIVKGSDRVKHLIVQGIMLNLLFEISLQSVFRGPKGCSFVKLMVRANENTYLWDIKIESWRTCLGPTPGRRPLLPSFLTCHPFLRL